MRIWKDRLARVRGAVDRNVGEELAFSPIRPAGDFKAGDADPDRTPFVVVAPFVVGEGEAESLGAGGRTSWAASLPVGEAEAHIDPTAYPAALSLRKGDRMTATDRGDATFEVARLDRNQRNRLVVRFTAT